MPFPLAHPAAVLPLRRFCPRRLSFPALVLGSIAPDAGYLFGPLHLDVFSHTALGGVAFGWPAGLGMVGLFYRLRTPVVERLPRGYRELFGPLCRQPAPGLAVLLLSVLLGVYSHLLWDGFTHLEGWFVRHLALLQVPVLVLGHRHLRVCHVLWYGSSFLGIAWLYWTYQCWRQSPQGGSRPSSPPLMLRNAGLVALLTVPAEALHHLFNYPLENYVVGALTLAIVFGALWRLDANTT